MTVNDDDAGGPRAKGTDRDGNDIGRRAPRSRALYKTPGVRFFSPFVPKPPRTARRRPSTNNAPEQTAPHARHVVSGGCCNWVRSRVLGRPVRVRWRRAGPTLSGHTGQEPVPHAERAGTVRVRVQRRFLDQVRDETRERADRRRVLVRGPERRAAAVPVRVGRERLPRDRHQPARGPGARGTRGVGGASGAGRRRAATATGGGHAGGGRGQGRAPGGLRRGQAGRGRRAGRRTVRRRSRRRRGLGRFRRRGRAYRGRRASRRRRRLPRLPAHRLRRVRPGPDRVVRVRGPVVRVRGTGPVVRVRGPVLRGPVLRVRGPVVRVRSVRRRPVLVGAQPVSRARRVRPVLVRLQQRLVVQGRGENPRRRHPRRLLVRGPQRHLPTVPVRVRPGQRVPRHRHQPAVQLFVKRHATPRHATPSPSSHTHGQSPRPTPRRHVVLCVFFFLSESIIRVYDTTLVHVRASRA